MENDEADHIFAGLYRRETPALFCDPTKADLAGADGVGFYAWLGSQQHGTDSRVSRRALAAVSVPVLVIDPECDYIPKVTTVGAIRAIHSEGTTTMTIRQLKISGPAEVDRVWARLTNFDLWPTWSPQILRVESEDDRIRRGTVGTVRSLAAIGIPFVITEHDETARSWSWIVRLGLVTATMHHRASSHQRAHSRPHGSKVDFTIESHPVLAAAYLPAAAVALTRLVK